MLYLFHSLVNPFEFITMCNEIDWSIAKLRSSSLFSYGPRLFMISKTSFRRICKAYIDNIIFGPISTMIADKGIYERLFGIKLRSIFTSFPYSRP